MTIKGKSDRQLGCGLSEAGNILILIYNSVLANHQQMNQSELSHHVSMSGGLMAVGFEKNYPKNIFIPIIEYLCEVGYQELYQRCVGTRQLFEGKNVVSLAVIYQLLAQPWFIQGVDRQNCFTVVSRTILLNSKIKKKIFHLKMAETILEAQVGREREFKTFVSKQVSSISTSLIEQDQFVSFPNLTLYLLYLMTNTICLHFHSQPCSRHGLKAGQYLSKDEETSCQLSSKEEFKMYIRQLVALFNDHYPIEETKRVREVLSVLIYQKQTQIQEKYKMGRTVLDFSIFLNEIAYKLLECRQKLIKITNLLVYRLIDNFKTAFLRLPTQQKRQICAMQQQLSQNEGTSTTILAFEPRIFCPYVFTHTGRTPS